MTAPVSRKPEIVALGLQGLRDLEIAERLGITRGYAANVLRMTGLGARRPYRVRPRNPEAVAAIDWEAVEVLADPAFAWSTHRIATHFRVAPGTIQAGMRRLGIVSAFVPGAGRRKRVGELAPADPSGLDHPSLAPLVTETISRAEPAQSSF